MLGNNKFHRRSDWRRWDLHIHIPRTVFVNSYNGFDCEAWKEFIKKIDCGRKHFEALGEDARYMVASNYKNFFDQAMGVSHVTKN